MPKIDIDSFLEKYSEIGDVSEVEVKPVEVNSKITSKKNTKIDLNFEKEVKEKLDLISKDPQNLGFDFLKKAYGEVTKFDKSLLNKFLDVERNSNLTVKNLGDKYSLALSNNLKQAFLNKENEIKKYKSLLITLLKKNDFDRSIILMKKIEESISSIAENFTTQKTKLYLDFKNLELDFNSRLNDYNEKKLKQIKDNLKLKVLNLNSKLKKNNFLEIETLINDLKIYFKDIPLLFTSSLIMEREFVTKILIKSYIYLEKEKKRNFNFRISIIENLIEKFHNLRLEKKVEEVLLIYNEIIFEFEKLPNLFFDEKVNLFKEINTLYSLISQILIKDNVSRFYETYNHGKSLEEIREYLEHVQKTKKISRSGLQNIKKSLELLPNKYLGEKQEFESQLKKLEVIISNSEKNKLSFPNSGTFFKKSEVSNSLIKKTIEDKFKSLKETKDIKKLKNDYSDILFNIKLLEIPNNKKKLMIKKLNNLIMKKNLK